MGIHKAEERGERREEQKASCKWGYARRRRGGKKRGVKGSLQVGIHKTADRGKRTKAQKASHKFGLTRRKRGGE